MKNVVWTSEEINEALSVNLEEGIEAGQVHFNSKLVKKDDIFIALPGITRDGHEFVEDALKNGAKLVIVSKKIPHEQQSKFVFVQNTLEALDALASYKKARCNAKIIAITGSVGKTSTKQALDVTLQTYGKTYASPASFNNHLGVRLSFASIANDTKYVVIEMGMNAAGEIDKLSKFVKPDISVITSIDKAHIGFFASVEDIADAKCEIFNYLSSREGIAIVNADMTMLPKCKKYLLKKGISKVITFGNDKSANVRILKVQHKTDLTFNVKYKIFDEILELNSKTIPPSFIYNFACVLSVLKSLNLNIKEENINPLKIFEPSIGRGKIVDIDNGIDKYLIISDYYNSNPKSLSSALEYLSLIKHDKKVAIIGDMKELGQFESQLHFQMVEPILKSGIKKLFLVGDAMGAISSSFKDKIKTYKFADTEELSSSVKSYLDGGELILIKGSRGTKLERIAECLGVKDAL